MMLLPPFRRCPDCSYDLPGLYPPHACPECGLAYDRETRVWRPRRVAVATLRVVFGSAAFIGSAAMGVGFSGDGQPVAVIGISLFVALATAGGLMVLILARRVFQPSYQWKPFAAVTPNGICIRTLDGLDLKVRWDELDAVEALDSLVLMRLVGEAEVHKIRGIFENAREAGRFVRAATEGRAPLAACAPVAPG